MIFTRKIGKLVRGNATPFQIYAAGLLGPLIGFTPDFDHAPGLILFLVISAAYSECEFVPCQIGWAIE